jgi:ribosomal protein S18 acetylase RimI-like enzyme
MDIRYFENKDCKKVVDLFENVVKNLIYYNDLAKEHEIKRYSELNLIEKIKEDPKSIIVAEVNNDIIGVCFNRFDDFTLWLEWIIISSTDRNKGVGKLLIHALEKSARERDCHKIWCDCRTSNSVSKSFLQSCGFDIIATIEKHWYQQDFVILQKFVNAQ